MLCHLCSQITLRPPQYPYPNGGDNVRTYTRYAELFDGVAVGCLFCISVTQALGDPKRYYETPDRRRGKPHGFAELLRDGAPKFGITCRVAYQSCEMFLFLSRTLRRGLALKTPGDIPSAEAGQVFLGGLYTSQGRHFTSR
jgi:hypothetical protein